MGTKSPSDVSGNWVEGPQLRSHGPVQQCASCRRDLAVCACATPSTSSGIPFRRSRPKKRLQQPIRDENPNPTRRQLFPSEEVSVPVAESSLRGRHTCPQCPKSFGSPGKLSQHLYTHTGERPFVCQHCSKAFSSRFKLVRHALIHSDQRQYRCLSCDRTFHRKDHLKNHSKVHSLIKRRYKCDREGCGKEYSSPISYRKHVAVHAAEDGNLECTICGKTCATKEEIVLHLKIHAGSRTVKTQADRKYRCDHCDRSFFTGKDVRRHLVVHTGKRDFLCQFCPQRFGRKDHLVRHIKKSHSHIGKKGKKKTEPKTKSVSAIMEETCTRSQELEEVKSETASSFGIFDDEDTDLPSGSDIFRSEAAKDLNVHISQAEELLSETSGSMMSDSVYQNPPPPYPLSSLPSTMTFDPGTSTEVIDIKPEVLASDFITLLPHQFQSSSLPPNLLLTAAESPDLSLMSNNPFIDPEDEPSLHRQFLQMSNYITPHASQSPPEDLVITEFITDDIPSSSTPLPRFNQAFHQPP